ncbi:MAG: CDP-glycerol glycerophosphotransferase family protein [Brachybacterium sp.]|uniref:CDP-glycerol glycerophosphotransferase family protein n=1 Tax=Brachybacterium sp. TaxID=1891286 RepID=UPI002647966B|nr:CDP-glycerol glycerophosphotransferase family protein [Brachybacterium sp.]MDN5687583.1 CDP-glycerol glycerophosphotransferase family protein [Brachybacterium sp.]
MPARGNSLRRRVRSLGGKIVRRYRLLPGGTPDGLGDDDALRDATLEGEVIVYFADTADSLYQLRTWYGPLRELHRTQGVTVVCSDSRAAATIREESALPVVTIARGATLDAIILRSEIKLVLYVNFNARNTAPLRSRSAIHISLLHGDSDKAVSVSNQVKAYDYSFVAGQAAIDRLERYTSLFDAAARCIPIGRPSLDTDSVPRSPRSHDRPVVLYAPTWEGGQASVGYCSLLTHGASMVQSLLNAGLAVIYRPHPLTGVRVPEFGEADAVLRAQVESAGSLVSTNRSLQQDFADADLLLCDVSAVANDWLPTGRPLIVTRPTETQARDAATALLGTVPRLTADEAPDSGRIARKQIEHDPLREKRIELTEYYLGDTAPGASLQRFLDACRHLAARRDELWNRIQKNEGISSPDPS